MDLAFMEMQYSARASIALARMIGFFGITVQLYANDSDAYTDTYGMAAGIDTLPIGEAKGLLFNYEMQPVAYNNSSVFQGGYLYYIDPIVDMAKTVQIINQVDGSVGRTYKLEQTDGQGVTTQLYRVRKMVSMVQ